MAKYKFTFKIKNDKCRFELYPNNSNTQLLGYSCDYDSYNESLDGLEKFIEYIKNNTIDSFKSKYTELSNNDNNYSYKYIIDSENVFYGSKYEKNINMQKIICNIYNHIINEEYEVIKIKKELDKNGRTSNY